MTSAALSGARARLSAVAARAVAFAARPVLLAPAATARRLSSRRTIMSDAPAPSSSSTVVARSAEVDNAAPAAATTETAAADAPEITKLDIRVGKILSIEVHPDADG